ncbi:MAG: PEPxxWA-CTERM sorting domain-containing protein [Caulobacteraceae bacterium]
MRRSAVRFRSAPPGPFLSSTSDRSPAAATQGCYAGSVYAGWGGDYTAPGYLDPNLHYGLTYIRNITVTPLPEPATWVMMIGGLTALGLALRSRRNVCGPVAS